MKFSNAFIQDLNKDAERIISESKEKMKQINKEHAKIAQLEQQIRTVESQIKKKEEDKETYETYKKFFIELYEPAMKNLSKTSKVAESKNKEQEKLFLTRLNEDGATKEEVESSDNKEGQDENNCPEYNFDNPQQMVELLKKIDDATIFLIHNTQEKEEDLEKTRKAFELQKQQITKKFEDRKESLLQVQKQCEKLEKVN